MEMDRYLRDSQYRGEYFLLHFKYWIDLIVGMDSWYRMVIIGNNSKYNHIGFPIG